MSKYPNRLRHFRKLRGKTQVQLAFQSGVTQAAISALENGEIQPLLLTALRIAKNLGVTVEEIWPLPVVETSVS